MDDNTFLLQEPEDSGGVPPAAPLFLIHDGGGTVFQYFSLGELDRPVYAIGNPRYDSGEPWTGGIPEMARAYAQMVRKALPPAGGDQIILGVPAWPAPISAAGPSRLRDDTYPSIPAAPRPAPCFAATATVTATDPPSHPTGWSLGGLVALELAHILSTQTQTTATPSPLGVIMIDSAHPRIARDEDKDSTPTFQPDTKPHVRENITRCFREATRIIAAYEPPGVWAGEGVRVVLLRAAEGRRRGGGGVNAEGPGEGGGGMMGWEGYAGGRVVGEDDVVEIEGSHFTIFEKKNVDSVTRALKRSCDALQRGRACRIERDE